MPTRLLPVLILHAALAQAGDVAVTRTWADLLRQPAHKLAGGETVGWHFLTRWWVNGRPFIPKQLGSLSDQNVRVIMGKILELRLALDPAKIGAKPGDRIGLQLLHCPQGWTLATGVMEQLADLSRDQPLPRLTNRIDFIAPGRSASF